jgi:hypothetical protein
VKTNLGISYGSLKEFFQILITLLILIARLAPLSDRLAVENENMEECIEEQDNVWLNRDAIEQHWLRSGV